MIKTPIARVATVNGERRTEEVTIRLRLQSGFENVARAGVQILVAAHNSAGTRRWRVLSAAAAGVLARIAARRRRRVRSWHRRTTTGRCRNHAGDANALDLRECILKICPDSRASARAVRLQASFEVHLFVLRRERRRRKLRRRCESVDDRDELALWRATVDVHFDAKSARRTRFELDRSLCFQRDEGEGQNQECFHRCLSTGSSWLCNEKRLLA